VKWILVILNVVAAVALVLLGSFAIAAHRTHAYSVYVELKGIALWSQFTNPVDRVTEHLGRTMSNVTYLLQRSYASSCLDVMKIRAFVSATQPPLPDRHRATFWLRCHPGNLINEAVDSARFFELLCF
jgi:hypothetical protein